MKPALTSDAVARLVAEVMGQAPRSLERLVEGMESQAFRFAAPSGEFVVRISPTLRGFEKDRWANVTVGRRVPVPEVVALGWADGAHAYCISEWAPGATLEAVSSSEAERVAAEVADVWRTIAETDVSSIDGCGDFDPDGTAPARSWREVLTATAHDLRRDLPAVLRGRGSARALSTYERLIEVCPEERGLVHGDFGSNNVLVANGRITAVVDWDLAQVGDPLHDVANCHFWATRLPCMRVQASHFRRRLSHLPAYAERVLCYALRIGLLEAWEHARAGELDGASWALDRSLRLVDDLSA